MEIEIFNAERTDSGIFVHVKVRDDSGVLIASFMVSGERPAEIKQRIAERVKKLLFNGADLSDLMGKYVLNDKGELQKYHG